MDKVMKKEWVIPMNKVNQNALLLILPITCVYALPYFFMWHVNVFAHLAKNWLVILLTILPGIVLHEALHALGWALFSTSGFKAVRFGVNWEYLTPYCHGLESVKVWQYGITTFLPIFFMGMVPGAVALITENGLLMFLAIFFTWTAGGDLQLLYLLRKIKYSKKVQDHTSELGFVIVD